MTPFFQSIDAAQRLLLSSGQIENPDWFLSAKQIFSVCWDESRTRVVMFLASQISYDYE